MLYWYGRPEPLNRALWIASVLPLLVMFVFAIEPAVRIYNRLDDDNRDARLIEGNGVKLLWAHEGPGFNIYPKEPEWKKAWLGPSWEEARQICRYLREDGKSLSNKPQNIWRLPTIDEVVRSMCRHGKNAGGIWDSLKSRATYKIKPDKESPLWNPYSPIIYWWTGTEKDEKTVYTIVYNGKVWIKSKHLKMGSRGFRAVKEP